MAVSYLMFYLYSHFDLNSEFNSLRAHYSVSLGPYYIRNHWCIPWLESMTMHYATHISHTEYKSDVRLRNMRSSPPL